MTEMQATKQRPLNYFLELDYPFNVLADPDGGYVIVFPDLPGCLTQAESVDEIGAMADEARRLWIETEYDDGADIPMPSVAEDYSGKFNVRLSKSLHRVLVTSAEREGVSLNTYVVTLLARGDAQARIEHRLEQVVSTVDDLDARLMYNVSVTVPEPRASVRGSLPWAA